VTAVDQRHGLRDTSQIRVHAIRTETIVVIAMARE
jgi:hypothetical protein